jgi:hypothetical protein
MHSSSSSSTFAGPIITTVLVMLKRLTASLQLLRLAEEAVPALVKSGRTTNENAQRVLDQIPALRNDIDLQVNAAKIMMESIQDRVETVAQFLLLHRCALNRGQSEDLDRWLVEVRG